MTQLGREAPEDLESFFRSQHAQWVTQGHVLEELLEQWGMTNTVIGARIATGEATEVYRVYDGSTNDIIGYLRIAHRGSGALNGSEIALMKACFENGLPAVELFKKKKSRFINGDDNRKVVITFVAPASGINLSDAIDAGDFDDRQIQTVARNVGHAIAKIHELAANSPKVSKRIGKFLRKDEMSDVQDFYERAKNLMQNIPDATNGLEIIGTNLDAIESGLREIRNGYPAVMIHSDVEPKHIFFDPESLDITAIIDFGSAQVNSPHFDFLNWKTFSRNSFDHFLEGYTTARFGADKQKVEKFVGELDIAEVSWQLDWAIYRMEQLLVREAVGHLELGAQAAARITPLKVSAVLDRGL